MKRLGAFVAAMLIMIQFCAISVHSETETLGNSSGTAITSYGLSRSGLINISSLSLVTGKQAFILPRNGDVRELPLLTWANAVANNKTLSLGVSWNYDLFDESIPGRQMLSCDVVIPEGYVYSGEPRLEQMVIVYDPSLTGVETVVDRGACAANIIPAGDGDAAREAYQRKYGIDNAGQSGLEEFFAGYGTDPSTVRLEGGYYFYYPSVWDVSYVDIHTPGSYFPFSSLPPFFKMEYDTWQRAAVHVLDPNAVDLRAWSANGGDTIILSWIREISQPELWVSVDGDPWQYADTLPNEEFWDSSSFFYYFIEEYPSLFTCQLIMYESAIPDGHTYEFEIRYEDDGVSTNSFLLDLTDGAERRYGNRVGSRGGEVPAPFHPEGAMIPPTEPGEAWGRSILVDSVSTPREGQVFVMPLGASSDALMLPTTTTAGLRSGYSIDISINWDINALDFNTSGWQEIAGEVAMPLGFSYPDYIDLSLRNPVLIYDIEQVGVQEVIDYTNRAWTYFPKGEDEIARQIFANKLGIDAAGIDGIEKQLLRWAPYEATVDLDESHYFQYPAEYDLSLINVHEVGSYYPYTELPAYFLQNDIVRQHSAIHIIEPDEVDLRAWEMSSMGGTFTFPWFKRINEPELWISIDDGEWRDMDTISVKEMWGDEYDWENWSPYGFRKTTWWDPGYDFLNISEYGFPDGHKYEFEVRYENDGYSVNSFVMDLTTERHRYYGDGGGPRGGEDREETPKPPIDPGNPEPPVDPPPKPPVDPEVPPTDPLDPTKPGEEPTPPIDPGPEPPKPGDGPESPVDPQTPIPPTGPTNPPPAPPDTVRGGDLEVNRDQPDQRARGGEIPPATSQSPELREAIVSAEQTLENGTITNGGVLPVDNDDVVRQASPEAHPSPTPDMPSSVEPPIPEAAALPTPDGSHRRGVGSIVIISVASIAGAFVLWKVFGRWLVKSK